MATTSTVYAVEGMHCGGCAQAVGREVEVVAGVSGVDVDVDTGRVTVTTDGPADEARVRAAVEQAGYAVRERL